MVTVSERDGIVTDLLVRFLAMIPFIMGMSQSHGITFRLI